MIHYIFHRCKHCYKFDVDIFVYIQFFILRKIHNLTKTNLGECKIILLFGEKIIVVSFLRFHFCHVGCALTTNLVKFLGFLEHLT